MFKYVSRRVRDTIQLGFNVRKSFNCNVVQQQQQHDPKLNYSVVQRQQDPSRDKDKSDEKFKKKYTRLNNNQCFLNALTWSTALITGFYASQILCLYRRNQRLKIDGSRCYYSKYLLDTSQSIHKNVKHLLTTADERSILQLIPKFECPFKRAKNLRVRLNSSQQKRTIEDEFKDFKNFVDPGYQQYERFFDNRYVYTSCSNVYNVQNDAKSETTQQKPRKDSSAKKDDLEKVDEEDAAIDGAIRQLAHIVGELEFQMGIDSVMTGNFNEAADHFKLSTNHNHPGGIFNLGICYEQGTGVKKNLKTARTLYEIASRLGHAKALYNLGVFHAQGLGGANKDSRQAKQYFQQAAELGNNEAIEALQLYLPKPKVQTLKPKLPIIKEFPEDEFYFKDKMMSKAVNAIAMNQHQMMRRVAA